MKLPNANKQLKICIALLIIQGLVFTVFTLDATNLKLKDYRPVSIYKVPQTKIEKAKYPVIDFHTHDEPQNAAEVNKWVATMNEVGITKSIILSYETGAAFDRVVDKYAPYKDRFEIWCGFDYTGLDKKDWSKRAIAELERCYKKGARGVGELGDKGLGEEYSKPTPAWGLHIDDPRLQPLLKRCGELHMPVSIHIGEDAWMYLPPNASNDGMMNAATWHVDMTKKGILNHDQLLATLEHALRDNPNTTFIACHLANTCSNLSQLGKLFDQYPNLYADVAARYGELAPIPRYVHEFLEKYNNRIVYGTDMSYARDMYEITFRILESADEHFYDIDRFGYHWPLYGLYLSDSTLKKIYFGNSKQITNP